MKEAGRAGKKLRIAGAGHSWSSIACTDDYMVNLDLYDKVISIDREKKQVRVQAGIRLRRLNRILDDHGLALINLGSVSEQSIAGATATGTHGTGIGFQILSSAVIAMRAIKADGETVEISESNPLMDAFRVSLGVLGIISELTLQCTDAFRLREDSQPMLFDRALDMLPDLVRQNDHLKLWWFPHVRHLMVYRYNREGKHDVNDGRPASNYLFRWAEEVLLMRYFFALLLRAGNAVPRWIPAINRFIAVLHLKKIKRAGVSHEIFNVPMPPRHRESEYAIAAEKAADALRALRDAIDRHGMKVNFVVEVRFAKSDAIWLSPACGRDTCFIGGYLYGDKRWQAYFALFERVMKSYDGRPHWGKEFTPALHDFRKMYPMFNDFVKLKKQLDAENMLGNKLTEQIFGS